MIPTETWLFVINYVYVELMVFVGVNIPHLVEVCVNSAVTFHHWSSYMSPVQCFCVMSFLSLICMQVAMREIFRFPLLHDSGCGFTALILTFRPSSTVVTATLFIIRSEMITRKVCGRNTFLTSAGLL
jgi:hypothetical protein